MNNILKLKTDEFTKLLNQYGLQKLWISLLATHLHSKSQFNYILENPDFSDAKILEVDLLDGLSIGEISVLYEFTVAKIDSSSRKSNGQFFTPDDVAQFMASLSLSFPVGTWLDPCSGIGNLSWHLIASQDNPERFLSKNMILADRDELALLIARTLLTFSFQKKNTNLFNELESQFIKFDFLSVADNGTEDLFSIENNLNLIPKHDFIIINPPYLATTMDGRFETAESRDLYAYFLENTIKSSSGFVSITPQSFTNAKKFRSVRKLLLKRFSSLTIYNFDNIPGNIFYGVKFGSKNSNTANSIRVAICVAAPGKGKRQITALSRWKRSQRQVLFSEIHRQLSSVPLSIDYFPKVSKKYEDLYMTVLGLKKLETLIVDSPTKFALYLPSSPRYFISALKRPAKRESQKTIFFSNNVDRNYAYLLLNSSFMYWWWRVRDGGMTLSLQTIKSLPLLAFNPDEGLVKALEISEKKNKVYKVNAGAPQENVKHPKDLLSRLNKIVVPKYASRLISIHNNSDILGKK